MPRQIIQTDEAPAAIGPYSQGTIAGDFVFTAGQIALDPQSGEVVGEDAAAQTRQALQNARAVIAAAGCSLADVVKVERPQRSEDDDLDDVEHRRPSVGVPCR